MSAADDGRVERLLIVRLSAMGDVIHTLPAAQALRYAFPDAMIGWLIEERWAELLCAPGAAKTRCAIGAAAAGGLGTHGRPEGMAQVTFCPFTASSTIARVWNDVRAADYQVAIDLQGAIRSAVLARWSGAPVVYGAREPRESAAALWYTRQTTARGKHVIEQGLSIVESLVGKKLIAPAVEFPRDAGAEERIEQKLREAEIEKFAILNPGAGWGAKQWPAERYGQVARALARCGVQSVVNYGPGEEDLALAAETAERGRGSGVSVFDQRTDRAHAAGEAVCRRRYGASASGRGVEGSRGGDLWSDGSGAQRAVRDAQHRAAESGKSDDARTQSARGRGDARNRRGRGCRRCAGFARREDHGGSAWLSGRGWRGGFEFRWDLRLPCCTSGWLGLRGDSLRLAQ